MEPTAAGGGNRPRAVGARRPTAYERSTTGPAAPGRANGPIRKQGDGKSKANERGAKTDDLHRRHMLLARMTRGAQQRKTEQAAIRAISDPDARKAAERESEASYNKSPEDHAGRRVGKRGLRVDKPKLEATFEKIGQGVAGTAKRIQRDIRYTLAPPDKQAMKTGGGGREAPAERASAAARPAPVPERTMPKIQAQPELAR